MKLLNLCLQLNKNFYIFFYFYFSKFSILFICGLFKTLFSLNFFLCLIFAYNLQHIIKFFVHKSLHTMLTKRKCRWTKWRILIWFEVTSFMYPPCGLSFFSKWTNAFFLRLGFCKVSGLCHKQIMAGIYPFEDKHKHLLYCLIKIYVKSTLYIVI